ncbi:Tat pathway signal sequence domain protein [Sphingomonas sp. BIUV-7]|uniref:Tat pathway signal sequence domain protein n=1 Tax=Sphingomonas natans TaxID=3063330 RepID=A0ABT8Y3J3_9SPHN|nr:Tat pathway signal sequence domain protein [Sphingomonas sp. BIUV-7]MDO6412877.1 Tat pathway signal sequence domain protein [Sphingomonas sp. BIUV-7]
MQTTRRDTLKLIGATALVPAAAVARPAPAKARPTALHWIEGETPKLQLGQTLGVAWPRGALPRRATFAAESGGKPLPAQSWVTATWPDGSVKWTAHALEAGTAAPDVIVRPGKPIAPATPVRIEQRADAILIRIGSLAWEIPRSGDALIRSAMRDGRRLMGALTLVGSVRPSLDGAAVPFTGHVDQAVVEQSGSVRAVVKLTGMHVIEGRRRWLPFTVRLYAYAGANHLRVLHSFVFDGDPQKDFLASLGLRAAVPMRGEPHDRHVRFATGGPLFAEAVRPLTGLRRDPGARFREAQIAGRAVPDLASMNKAVREGLDTIPTWGDFALEQPTADGFRIEKRTTEGFAWIASRAGKRAPGLAYVGSPTGGVALAQRWFWQRHPSALAIRDAAQDEASVTAWLWSPAAPPMDLRTYRGVMGMEGYDAQNRGLDITYEDYEPGWDSATGIGRTNELTLWALDATPTSDTLQAMAEANALPPQLMADPAALHAAAVFGDWGLPDRSTPNRTIVENQLDNLVDFYAHEVEARSWYGFWDHGDVMHTYDGDRHVWRYDIGGFAWDNSELSPDLWLWQQALRTGKAQAWRLAEAMTRHTSEVDTYHLGRFNGLGTRHGVQHWSDSSKQPRVSNAAYRRIYYYLTADDRVGDILRDLLTSDQALATVDIGRKIPGAKAYAGPAGTFEMGFGPSWTAYVAAWLTEWERTGDTRWRDRIMRGMAGIARLKYGWMTNTAPYDPRTGNFVGGDEKIRLQHLTSVFGAVEINAELIQLIDMPAYRAAWLDYCRWFNAPKAEYIARFGEPFGARNLREGYSRLTAYAARASGDTRLADRAAVEFFSGDQGLGTWTTDPRHEVAGVVEWPSVSTNAAAQWGLAAIQMLALVPDAIDRATIPPHNSSAQEPRTS